MWGWCGVWKSLQNPPVILSTFGCKYQPRFMRASGRVSHHHKDVAVSDDGWRVGSDQAAPAADTECFDVMRTDRRSPSPGDKQTGNADRQVAAVHQGAEGVPPSECASRAGVGAGDAPPPGFLFMSAVMMAIGIAGASPRALVLLLSRLVPSVAVAQALSDFPALWAPCAKEGATFPAHSPGGSLYKFLVGADGVLKSGFMMLSLVAALAAVAPGGARSRGRNRGVRRCAALICALLFVAATVHRLCLLMLAPTVETLYALWYHEEAFTGITALLVIGTILLLTCLDQDARESMGPSTTRHATMPRVKLARVKLVSLLAVRPLYTSVSLFALLLAALSSALSSAL